MVMDHMLSGKKVLSKVLFVVLFVVKESDGYSCCVFCCLPSQVLETVAWREPLLRNQLGIIFVSPTAYRPHKEQTKTYIVELLSNIISAIA